jgi:tetratricopeptide (TPR) repeat protein
MEKDRQKPSRSASCNQRGIELADRGWLDESLREFERAIELDGESPFPRINRASVLMEQGRYLEALQDLLQAVKSAPEEPAAHYHLGMFLSRFGPNLAISELQTTLSVDPDQVDALLQLGATFAELGETRDAEEALQAAFELDHRDPLVNRELGVLMMERNHVHQAISHLKYAASLLPGDAEIRVDLGMAYIQAGFYEQAEIILREVLGSDPENLHAHYNLAAIYADWEKTEAAIGHLKQAAATGFIRVRDWLADDRMFDKLRADGRFKKFLEADRPPDVG